MRQIITQVTFALAFLSLTSSLLAQEDNIILENPPREITIDGSLEGQAQVRGLSENGRYIWAAYYDSQVAYVYDTAQEKCIWQRTNAGKEIDLKFVTNEGDIIFQKDKRNTLFIARNGAEILITSPDKEFPLIEITGVSSKGNRLVGNLKTENPFIRTCKPFVANRTPEGSFKVSLLPIPQEDALGGTPLETTVLAISPDGNILMGRQLNADGYYPRLMQWTIAEGSEVPTNYTFPGESLFFDTSKPKPGLEPQPEDYTTEEEWEKAWHAWSKLVTAFCKKPMLDPVRCYYSPSTHRILFSARLLVLDKETGAINQILMPGYWDVAEQRGEILQQFEGLTTAEALADGSFICIEEEVSSYHAYWISPTSGAKVNLGLWLKEKTGIPIEDYFLRDEKGELALGWPSISKDGKTLVLAGPSVSNPDGFRGVYLQFTKPLGLGTAIPQSSIDNAPQIAVSPQGEISIPQLAHHKILTFTTDGKLVAQGVLSASGEYQLPAFSTATPLFIMIFDPLQDEHYLYKILFPSPNL